MRTDTISPYRFGGGQVTWGEWLFTLSFGSLIVSILLLFVISQVKARFYTNQRVPAWVRVAFIMIVAATCISGISFVLVGMAGLGNGH